MAKAKWTEKNDEIHAEMEKLLKKYGIWDKTFVYAFEVDGNLCSTVNGPKYLLNKTLEQMGKVVNGTD